MFLGFCIGFVFFRFLVQENIKRENQQKGEENIFAFFDFLDFFGAFVFTGSKKWHVHAVNDNA